MSEPKKRPAGWGIFLILSFLMLPVLAQGVELKEAVEQLAAQLGKSVPDGKTLRVAVTDFPDLQGVTSDLGRYIAERLTTRLSAQTQKFRVIERRRLGLVLGELKFSMSDLVDPNKAKQLGRMLGVEALVAGSLSDLGNVVDVDDRIIEIETNNILPGVSVSISKDQVVAQMLEKGREAAPPTSPPMGTPVPGGPGPPVASIPRRSGIHPIEAEFLIWDRGFENPHQFIARLHNIQIVEGRFLRFNFDFHYPPCMGMGPPRPLGPEAPKEYCPPTAEAFLDSTQETFLIDQNGRQHVLVRSTGISGDQPIRVRQDNSKPFTLDFPLPAEMESFTYRAPLFVRSGSKQGRIRIETNREISLKDFR